jgi:hypothetical protein
MSNPIELSTVIISFRWFDRMKKQDKLIENKIVAQFIADKTENSDLILALNCSAI